MKITVINPLKYNHNIVKRNKPCLINFKKNFVSGDYFQSLNSGLYKVVKIKDLEGHEIHAKIERKEPEFFYGADAKKFVISVNNNPLGNAIVFDYSTRYKGLFLHGLYTEENEDRHYRGAGTELLKCAAEESKQRGYNGQISCNAYNDFKPPFVFYYKNNFEIYDDVIQHVENAHLFNGPLQYAAKNNVSIRSLLSDEDSSFYMQLNKKGADMLLEGKRLYENRICDEVATFEIDGQRYSAQFIESPKEGEYFIQVLNESKDSDKLCLIAALKVVFDENGKKHFKATEEQKDFLYSCQEVTNFALSLIGDLEKKYL